MVRNSGHALNSLKKYVIGCTIEGLNTKLKAHHSSHDLNNEHITGDLNSKQVKVCNSDISLVHMC